MLNLSLAIAQDPTYVDPNFPPPPQGPFIRTKGSGNIAQKAIHLTDNTMVGAVQSSLSLLHIPYSFIDITAIGDSMGKRMLKMDTYNSPNSEIVQFVVKGNPINASAYSLGIGQVTPEGYEFMQDHESGHSVASAVLGPLYIPVVIVSYSGNGGHGGFVEDWADMESAPSDYSLTHSLQGGLAEIDVNGSKASVLVLSYGLNQTQQQGHVGSYGELDSLKIYEWLKTNIGFLKGEQIEDCDCDGEIINNASLSLLEKNVELVVSDSFAAEKVFNLLVQSTHNYGELNYDSKKGVEFIPMRWNANLGVEYVPANGVKLQATAGPILGSMYRDGEFSFVGGGALNLGVDYKDYVRLQNKTKWEFFSNGEMNFLNQTDLSNRYRDIRKDFGALHYLDFGLRHEYQELQLNSGQPLKSSYSGIQVGGRF